jgi:FixJ family two-component response regulator
MSVTCAERFSVTTPGGEVRQNMGKIMTAKRPLVSVVDDDESVRESLPDLLMELGYETQVFSSAEEFLKSDHVEKTKCLILDIAMPGMSGPELQDELTRHEMKIPVIFITAQKDEAVRLRMLARGAVDCLFQPLSDTPLPQDIEAALRFHQEKRGVGL